MNGTFGYELDVTRLSDEEKAQIPEQIKRYREIAPLIREGALYRLGNPFSPSGYATQMQRDYDAWMYVSGDKKSAVFTYVQITAEANMKPRRICLRGLRSDLQYTFTRNGVTETHSGAYLMQCGILIENLWGDMKSAQIIVRSEALGARS